MTVVIFSSLKIGIGKLTSRGINISIGKSFVVLIFNSSSLLLMTDNVKAVERLTPTSPPAGANGKSVA